MDRSTPSGALPASKCDRVRSRSPIALSGSDERLPRLSSEEMEAAYLRGVRSLCPGHGAVAAAPATRPPASNTGGKLTGENPDPLCEAVRAAYASYPLDQALRCISCKVEGVEKRIDWMNWAFPSGLRDVVADLVSSYVGGEFLPRDRGVNTYHYSSQNEAGGLLGWSEDRPEGWLSPRASLLS